MQGSLACCWFRLQITTLRKNAAHGPRLEATICGGHCAPKRGHKSTRLVQLVRDTSAIDTNIYSGINYQSVAASNIVRCALMKQQDRSACSLLGCISITITASVRLLSTADNQPMLDAAAGSRCSPPAARMTQNAHENEPDKVSPGSGGTEGLFGGAGGSNSKAVHMLAMSYGGCGGDGMGQRRRGGRPLRVAFVAGCGLSGCGGGLLQPASAAWQLAGNQCCGCCIARRQPLWRIHARMHRSSFVILPIENCYVC